MYESAAITFIWDISPCYDWFKEMAWTSLFLSHIFQGIQNQTCTNQTFIILPWVSLKLMNILLVETLLQGQWSYSSCKYFTCGLFSSSCTVFTVNVNVFIPAVQRHRYNCTEWVQVTVWWIMMSLQKAEGLVINIFSLNTLLWKCHKHNRQVPPINLRTCEHHNE